MLAKNHFQKKKKEKENDSNYSGNILETNWD